MELTEESARKPARRTTECSTLSNREKRAGRDRRPSQGPVGPYQKVQQALPESQKQGRGKTGCKGEETKAATAPSLAKDVIQEALQTPNRKKSKEIDTKTRHIQLVKTKDTEKHLGSSGRKTPLHL